MARKRKSSTEADTDVFRSPARLAKATPATGTDVEPEREEPVFQVVIIEKTGRVRRYGYTDFSEHLQAGEKILSSDRDFKEKPVFNPSIDAAVWRWNGTAFVKERELKRGEEVDWAE